MSSKYNLNEKVGQDFFDFTLDDFKYKMAYPSTKDLLDLDGVEEDAVSLQLKIDTVKLNIEKNGITPTLEKELNGYLKQAELQQTTFLDWVMGFIEPVDEKAPNLKEALMSKSIKYFLAFMNMIKTELNE